MPNSTLKLLPILLAILLIFLQYRLWFEAGGIMDMVHLKKDVALQKQENDKLKKRNEQVMMEVEHLQKDKSAVEARARTELGMVKKGEVFYQVIDES